MCAAILRRGVAGILGYSRWPRTTHTDPHPRPRPASGHTLVFEGAEPGDVACHVLVKMLRVVERLQAQ
jgi:hypothetical protein